MMNTRLIKHTSVCLLLIAVLLWSCNGRKQMLLGTWRVVKWQNPAFDSFFTKTKNYIDTIGKGHDDATNIAIYGVANMDSMRQILRKQYDSAKNAQEEAAAKTAFTFEKNGIVEVSLNGTADTGKWLMDNDNALIIEEKGFSSPQGISKYQIVELSDEQLVLRFYEDGDSSTVTFEHERK